MADIDVGSIGGSLELVDKSFSSTLSKGENAVSEFKSASDLADEAIKRLDRDFGAIEKGVQKFESSLKGANPEILTFTGAIGNIAEEAIGAFNPLTALGTVIGTAFAAAGAAVAGAAVAVGVATVKAANLGDELLTMSKQTNVSVEALSGWRYVADQVGVSFGTIANGISKFTSDLGKGSKQFKDAISSIGLSLSDLRNSKPEEAFQKTLDALGKVPNLADRAAVGTRLFGLKYKDLSALIGEDTKGMVKDLDSFGGTVTTEMAVAGDAFNDAKARIGSMVEAVSTQVGSIFVPVVAAGFKAVGDAWVEARKSVVGGGADFTEAIGKVGEFVITWAGLMIKSVAEVAQSLTDFFVGQAIASSKLVEGLAGVGHTLSDIGRISAILGGGGSGDFFKSMADNFEKVQEFAASAKTGVDNVKSGFDTAINTVAAFGDALQRNATGSVKAMRDSIADAAAETRKADGAFQGLGAQADQSANKAAMAWNRYVESIRANFAKQWAVIVKQANDSTKLVAEAFNQEMRDREDTDRTMRRLTQSSTQFEIGEIQKRLSKQRAYYDVLKLMGVDTSRALAAANEKAAASMLEVATKTDAFRIAMSEVLSLMGPFSGGINAAAGSLDGLETEYDNTIQKTQEFKDRMATLGNEVAQAFIGAFKSDNFGKALTQGLGGIASNLITSTVQRQVTEGIKNGSMSVGQGVLQTAGAAIGASIAVAAATHMWDVFSGEMDRRNDALTEAGHAAAAQFAAGFGGARELRDIFRHLNIDTSDPKFNPFGASSPTQFQEVVNRVNPLIQAFQERLKGLGEAAQGVNTLMTGVGASFTKSMKDQTDALDALQKAHIEAMKAGGATQEQITQDTDAFTESMKTHTFEATDAQIAAFNRVGTIAGGVIANMVNQTGDLVGAVLSVKDTLGTLDEIRAKFNLGDQIGAATKQVLGLYDAIIKNEDVFTSISGIGQIMNGLGDAMVVNGGLANAFGQELAADFKTLTDRGVDANMALASMAPQLQQLWELSKDGRIVVDETTAALLKQAEAAGVVGETQRSVNEQILAVLTDIRDMIGFVGNVAIPRLGTAAVEAGNAMRTGLGDGANDGATEVEHATQRAGYAMQHNIQTGANAAADATTRALGRVGKQFDAVDEDMKRHLKIQTDEAQRALDGLKAPPPITVKIDFDVPDWRSQVPDEWNPNPTGPPSRPTEQPEGFASGSRGFRDFGDGTPAMLHGLERVQTIAQYRSERASSSGSPSGPGVIVELDGDVLVAHNARYSDKWARIRAGRSSRTVDN